MHPLDFEEFAWALGEEPLVNYIKSCFEKRVALDSGMHHRAMMLFKQYMLVGGMPKPLVFFIENEKNFSLVDAEKRDILRLYRSDIMKIKPGIAVKFWQFLIRFPACCHSMRNVSCSKIYGRGVMRINTAIPSFGCLIL